ncbi:MAG: hypothetical protein KDA96_01350 [Planctomycetaceae bacterium]|nr:hypothetical protein [Planctomycetaceae bacterium]
MKKTSIGLLCILGVGLTGSVAATAMRPWPRGAWDAADHDRDGILTRDEMLKFGQQKPHRNGPRLMMHFDAADTNHDQIVDASEIDAYGCQIGSKDPNDRLPPEEPTSQLPE